MPSFSKPDKVFDGVNRNCISVRNNVIHVVCMFEVYTSYIYVLYVCGIEQLN